MVRGEVVEGVDPVALVVQEAGVLGGQLGAELDRLLEVALGLVVAVELAVEHAPGVVGAAEVDAERASGGVGLAQGGQDLDGAAVMGLGRGVVAEQGLDVAEADPGAGEVVARGGVVAALLEQEGVKVLGLAEHLLADQLHLRHVGQVLLA